jgi:hypothetical protein
MQKVIKLMVLFIFIFFFSSLYNTKATPPPSCECNTTCVPDIQNTCGYVCLDEIYACGGYKKLTMIEPK